MEEPVGGAHGPLIPVVVLAAGLSSRVPGNKLLRLIDGEAMVRRSVALYAFRPGASVLVVVGHDRERVAEALQGLPVTLCANEQYATGKASSIAAGVRALPRGAQGALFAQADMPFIRPHTVDLLCAAFPGPDAIVAPRLEGRIGSPKVFGASFFPDLCGLSGEQTGMELILRRQDRVVYVDVDDPGVARDLDTLEDFGG